MMAEWQHQYLAMATFVLCKLAIATILYFLFYPILVATLASTTTSTSTSLSFGSREDEEYTDTQQQTQQLSPPPSDFQRWFDEALQKNESMKFLSSTVKDHGDRLDECKENQETNNAMFSILNGRLNTIDEEIDRSHQVQMSQNAVSSKALPGIGSLEEAIVEAVAEIGVENET